LQREERGSSEFRSNLMNARSLSWAQGVAAFRLFAIT
jgi:hypothetical protein